jgi:hypothetical protein
LQRQADAVLDGKQRQRIEEHALLVDRVGGRVTPDRHRLAQGRVMR